MFKHILSSPVYRILEVNAEMAVRGQLAQPPNSQIEAQRRYVMWQDQGLNLGLLTWVSASSIKPAAFWDSVQLSAPGDWMGRFLTSLFRWTAKAQHEFSLTTAEAMPPVGFGQRCSWLLFRQAWTGKSEIIGIRKVSDRNGLEPQLYHSWPDWPWISHFY